MTPTLLLTSLVDVGGVALEFVRVLGVLVLPQCVPAGSPGTGRLLALHGVARGARLATAGH